MPEDPKDSEYAVGYGRPPKHTRFQPGRSGNPKGRPKKKKVLKREVAEILNAPIQIQKSGVVRNMQAFEVGVRQLVRRALQDKDLKATLEFLKLCERYDIIKPPTADPGCGVLEAPRGVDFDEWVASEFHEGPLEDEDD